MVAEKKEHRSQLGKPVVLAAVSAIVLALALFSIAYAGDEQNGNTSPASTTYSQSWNAACSEVANSERPLPAERNAFPATMNGDPQRFLRERCAPYTQALIRFSLDHKYAEKSH